MIFARIGDSVIGTCVCSTPPYPDVGIIATGDPLHIDAGQPVARIGDTAIFSCGSAIISSGTAMDISCGQPVARTGDVVTGCANGTIVSTTIHVTI